MSEGSTKAGAFGRAIGDLGKLSDAENELLGAVCQGRPAYFGREIATTSEERTRRTVRAELVRFLALDGDDSTPVHEKGVRIQGALISNALDFEGCTLTKDIFLLNCELEGTLTLRDAVTRTINLEGSKCLNIVGDRLEVSGSLLLRRKFVATGDVRLLGAKISGTLDCGGGSFTGPDRYGNVLACDGIETGGAVHLNERFSASGIVRLVGARIGIDLNCATGTFLADSTGERSDVDRSQEKIAIDLSRAIVVGTLWLTGRHGEVAAFHGGVDLTSAKIGRIVDAVVASAPCSTCDALLAGARAGPTFLRLDGLTYDRFGEPTDVTALSRIAFLYLQREKDLEEVFKPQPWEQMIKVLRDMGHYREARSVAIEKQIRLRKAGKISGPRFWHKLYGGLSRYGYRPYLLILWALGIAAGCASLFEVGARYGVMMPTDRRILDEVKDPACRPELGGNWTKCPVLVGRYPTFDSIVFSIDQILPVISTQQSKDWAVATVQPCSKMGCFGFCATPAEPGISNTKAAYWPAGLGVWILARAENLIGWIFGLMFVAAVSGLIKRD
jgi:hypothetical protein